MMKSLNLKYLQQFIVLSLLALLSAQVLAGKRTTTYMHTDALGSVVAASDKDGNLLWRKQYMPFGSEINRDPNLKELSYTGKKFDAELGLSYSGARYYDPSLGRFGGIDPATALENVEPNPMMFNRYAYANNNPYRFVDPDGKESRLAQRLDVYVSMYATGQMTRDEYSSHLQAEATGGLMAAGGVGGAAARSLYVANAYRVNQGILMAGEITAGDALGGAALAGTAAKFTTGMKFGQSSVKSTFAHGPFKGRTIGDIADGLRSGTVSPDDLPVEFIVRNGEKVALNNRSLTALRRAGMQPTRMIDRTGSKVHEKLLDSHLRGGQPSYVIRVRGSESNASLIE